MFKAGVGVEVL